MYTKSDILYKKILNKGAEQVYPDKVDLSTFHASFDDIYDFYIDTRTSEFSSDFERYVKRDPEFSAIYQDENSSMSVFLKTGNPEYYPGPNPDSFVSSVTPLINADKDYFFRKILDYKYDVPATQKAITQAKEKRKDPFKKRLRNIADIISADFEMSYYGGVEKGEVVVNSLYNFKTGDRFLYTNNKYGDKGFTLVIKTVTKITNNVFELALVGFREWFKSVEVEKITDFNELKINTVGIEKIVLSVSRDFFSGEIKYTNNNLDTITEQIGSPHLEELANTGWEDNPLTTMIKYLQKENKDAKTQNIKKENIADLLDNFCKVLNIFAQLHSLGFSVSWVWGGDRKIFVRKNKLKYLCEGKDFSSVVAEKNYKDIINTHKMRGKITIPTSRVMQRRSPDYPYLNELYDYIGDETFTVDLTLPCFWWNANVPPIGDYHRGQVPVGTPLFNIAGEDNLSRIMFGEKSQTFNIGEIVVPPGDNNQYRIKLKGQTAVYGKTEDWYAKYISDETLFRKQIETAITQNLIDRINISRFIISKSEYPNYNIKITGVTNIKTPEPHNAFISDVKNIEEYVNVSVNDMVVTDQIDSLYLISIPLCDEVEFHLEWTGGDDIEDGRFLVNILCRPNSSSWSDNYKCATLIDKLIPKKQKNIKLCVCGIDTKLARKIKRGTLLSPPYTNPPISRVATYNVPWGRDPFIKKLDISIETEYKWRVTHVTCHTHKKIYPEPQTLKFGVGVSSNNGGPANQRLFSQFISEGLPSQKTKLKYSGLESFVASEVEYSESPSGFLEDILSYNNIKKKTL